MSRLSRKMAHALRHEPHVYGLVPGPQGQIALTVFAEAMGVSLAQILTEVAADEKHRFMVQGDHIWAAQGHSFVIDMVVAHSCAPAFLYHGTLKKHMGSILLLGLVPGKRTMVHMTSSRQAAEARGDAVVSIPTYPVKGLVMASNGVWLAPFVPPELIFIH